MTEENKRKNIKSELDKASEILSEANLLYKNDYISGAVSRLYYSMLHIIRALLLTKGLEPKSHEGVLRIFSLHFVKEGPFDTKDAHLFARLMKYREEADYNPVYEFIEEDFVEFKKELECLSDKINEYLKERGYFQP
ncbi:MAG: HEPN domain-containing protein [bacterium]